MGLSSPIKQLFHSSHCKSKTLSPSASATPPTIEESTSQLYLSEVNSQFLTMNSIQSHSSLSSLFAYPQHTKLLVNPHKLLSHSNNRIPKLGQKMPHIRNRGAIISHSLLLADTVPVKGGDISVLLPTGGLMLLVYFIANFVVPSFIIKDLESDKETED